MTVDPLNGYIHVTLNGPFVTMEAERWDELKRRLKVYGFGFIEERPRVDGRSVRRVYRTPPGPKPKSKSRRAAR